MEKVIKLRDVLNIDTISKDNDMVWQEISDMVEDGVTTVFDLEDIVVLDPWNNIIFNKMVGKGNFLLDIYEDKVLVDNLNMFAVMRNGADCGNNSKIARNIEIKVEKEEKKDKNLLDLVKRFSRCIEKKKVKMR